MASIGVMSLFDGLKSWDLCATNDYLIPINDYTIAIIDTGDCHAVFFFISAASFFKMLKFCHEPAVMRQNFYICQRKTSQIS